MPTGWIVFVICLFLLGAFLGGIIEGSVGIGEGEVATIETLKTFDVFTIHWFGPLPIPWFNGEYWTALMDVLFWRTPLFATGIMSYIKYIFWAISIGVIMTVIVKLTRG